ncbi:MAG: polyphosphate kinase 1 [Treponema sp.]|jgi:polyphosphate kinase|nr:polyphosphate kinase 1 [Treponema sp.]
MESNISETTMPFINRDISWIDFNERVLEEGLRKNLLPMERLKYLSIVSSNFSEFFMVRVAAMKSMQASGKGPDISGMSQDEQLKKVSEKVRSILARQYRAFNEEIIPDLASGGLRFARPDTWSVEEKEYLESFFIREIQPVLTPLRAEEAETLPAIESSLIHAAFLLCEGENPEDNESEEKVSIIRIPPALERVVWIPCSSHGASWALLEDLVVIWGSRLYPGFRIKESLIFEINRDADFSVDERRDEDFISAMEEVLESREHSVAVCMFYAQGSLKLRNYLARRLNLGEDDLYEINGPVNLNSLYSLVLARSSDGLKEKPWKIYGTKELKDDESFWDRIKGGDILLHFPYQSFDPVIRFFQDAASDPDVISIKTALYRTSGNSPIIRALEQAALSGKHVTAVVELKARFDEERNISWANRLEKAGVIVVYGLARLKIHAKITVVVRREHGGIRRYVHLSTGNYNDRTAKLYQDLCLFTADEDIAYDAGLVFNMITGYSAVHNMRRLIIAPTSLKRRLLELIDREIRLSSPESPGRITAKMNSLSDPEIIEALYRASKKGVKISLNVRGICMLIPGMDGVSDNIRVVSVIDRYLEHSRIYYFANGGAAELYLSSADCMPRNLERRVEIMFPVLQIKNRRMVLEFLENYFRDNCQAWILKSDRTWERLEPGPEDENFRVQARLLALASESAETPGPEHSEFIVRRRADAYGHV